MTRNKNCGIIGMSLEKSEGKDVKLVHRVEKSKEGTYYTVPFTVPGNVKKITVSYDYERGTKGFMADLHPTNTIDLGLEDEKGNFLGWSGSAHKSIFVGEYGSSKGYPSMRINPGEWSIIVGAYHVVPQGVEVTYDIEFEEKGGELLFGDLHIHSDASDGKFDIPQLGKMAVRAGLDFVGIANHNNFCENLNLPHVDGLTFIPAVEWTHYKGHMNFFGVPAPFENSFIANNAEEMEKIISHARSLGAVISVNHPKCPFCPYVWKNEEAFDMAEIWNGPMRGTNIRGIAWWTEHLKNGRKIPIVGGSDYHRPGVLVRFANPVTGVISASRSAEDILFALKNGRAFVTSGVKGARLLLSCGDIPMGGTAKADGGARLTVNARNLSGARLMLVTAGGEKLLCRGKNEFREDVEISGTGFAYVKAVRGAGKLSAVTAISNPIYFE